MTTTLDGVTKKKDPAELSAEQQAATEPVRLARERGLSNEAQTHNPRSFQQGRSR
jgi:hypothetical protein